MVHAGPLLNMPVSFLAANSHAYCPELSYHHTTIIWLWPLTHVTRWWWQYFDAHGVECRILPLPTNEANKSFDLVFEITRQLEEFKLNRRALPASRAAAPLR